jgi:predicted PurR-regulated permease PerM|tara:strand:- start:92 stop:385 length:294 start_codon:yes stop_codon:yes gene_type:complete
MLIAIIILSILVVTLLVAVRNLLIKVEKYEDITVDQTSYLQKVSNLINDSQKHLKNLDEKGVFEADDEVGYFFEQMKNVQKELNRYMLPENYGKKEE